MATLYSLVSTSPSESCSIVRRQYLEAFEGMSSAVVNLVTETFFFMWGWKTVPSLTAIPVVCSIQTSWSVERARGRERPGTPIYRINNFCC